MENGNSRTGFDRALGWLGLWMLAATFWAAERLEARGATRVVALVVLGVVAATGWTVDRLPVPTRRHVGGSPDRRGPRGWLVRS
jgi:hypothetical protein